MDIILERFPSLTQILCRQFTARLKEANDVLKKLTADTALHTRQIVLEPGQTVIEQGAEPDKLYHLIFGTLQWEQDDQIIPGRPVRDFIEPSAYFSGAPYPATVRAKDPSCLVAIENTPKEAVVRNYPELVLELFAQAVSHNH